MAGAAEARRLVCAPIDSIANTRLSRGKTAVIDVLDAGAVGFILIASALALGLYLFHAGVIPLTDPDEGRYAEIAREMLLRRHWLVPRLFGIPYLEKPPLFYWLTAGSFAAFGFGELAARLVPALAAAGGVLAVGCFTRRHLGGAAGIWSSVVLALSALYFVVAHTVVVDMLFSTSLAVALFSFLAWREAPPSALGLAVLFWLGLAAATVTKGPAAIVLCGTVIVADALVGGTWRALRSWRLFLPAPVFLLTVLPWFVLVQARYPEYFSFYLWKEHLGRVSGSEHSESLFFFILWLLGGFFPWTPLAVALAPATWRAARGASPQARALRFLAIWASVVFVLFSLARGKLATYILPMFPPLAALVGYALDQALRGDGDTAAIERAIQITAGAFALGAVGTVVAAMLVPTPLGMLPLAALVAAAAAGAVTPLAARRSGVAMRLATLAISTAGIYLAMASAAPALARSFTARPLIADVAAAMKPGDEYALIGKYLPSAAFYLERPPLLVGIRPELRFGKALDENTPNIVPSLAELGRRTEGRHLFVLTDTRSKREAELREALGDVHLVARNYVAVLWERR